MIDIPESVVEAIYRGYELPLDGYHGPSHWGRVLENGLYLSDSVGADVVVVELFALFHDSRRLNENHDPGHGLRGARLAEELWHLMPAVNQTQMGLLVEACRDHTDVAHHDNPTIQVCWDADRLDLLRVGIKPQVEYLNTDAAKEEDTRRWANQRASNHEWPRLTRLWIPTRTNPPEKSS